MEGRLTVEFSCGAVTDEPPRSTWTHQQQMAEHFGAPIAANCNDVLGTPPNPI